MSSEVAKLKKPQLRGLLHSQIKKNLGVASVLSVIAGFGWWYFVMEKRKQAYADFYKNYDADKEFERMKNLGLFQSVRPDDE